MSCSPPANHFFSHNVVLPKNALLVLEQLIANGYPHTRKIIVGFGMNGRWYCTRSFLRSIAWPFSIFYRGECRYRGQALRLSEGRGGEGA